MIAILKKRLLCRVLVATMVFALLPIGLYANAMEYPTLNTHGYVKDVIFPRGTNAELLKINVPDYEFDPAVYEYDVVLSDIASGAGWRITVTFDNLPSNAYAKWMTVGNGGAETLVNGTEEAVSLDKEFSPANKFTMVLSGISLTVPKTLRLIVGSKQDDGTYTDADKYTFNLSRRPGFSKFEIYETETGGTKLALSPEINATTGMYIYQTLLVKANATSDTTLYLNAIPKATSGATIYFGETLTTPGALSMYELKLNDFTVESGLFSVPISIRYSNGEVSLRTDYTLIVSANDYRPTINTQPQGATADKNAAPTLSVTATASEGGVLSYQWREYNQLAINDELVIVNTTRNISNATAPSYVVDTTWAGPHKYDCVVRNIVGGVIFETISEPAEVTVNLTLVTAPTLKTPIVPANENSVFNDGETATFSFQLTDVYDGYYATEEGIKKARKVTRELVPIYAEVWRNRENSNVGGEKVSERVSLNAGTISSVSATADNGAGEWYYYLKLIAWMDGLTEAVTVTNTVKITIKSLDGVVSLSGTGTESNPYLICEANDLALVRAWVDDGITFRNKFFAFENDITLPADWQPIGKLKDGYALDEQRGEGILPFSGVFDGQGHTLTFANHVQHSLINFAREATVKNLNIFGEYIDNYSLVENYCVDYGPNGDYWAGEVPYTIKIENVTIKAGTQTLKAGFLGGYASGKNNVHIHNCTAEKGVVIGYNRDQSDIGTFAGHFNGTVENSISYADVYGVDTVGGLIGHKGQSMGSCDIINSAFIGAIVATGDNIGGIIGRGYVAVSAPATPVAVVRNCYVIADITGNANIGGIVGSEVGRIGYTNTHAITDNFFYGTLTGSSAGGTIGLLWNYMNDAAFENNFYLSTGASTGIGTFATMDADQAARSNVAMPLLSLGKTAEEFANGTVLALLNSGSYQNWTQGEMYPVIDETKVVMVSLEITALPTKTEYYIGDGFDPTGLKITATWSDGRSEIVPPGDVTVSGYDNTKRAVQTLTATYRGLNTTFQVTVLKKPDESTPNNPLINTINVSFTLLGAPVHDSEADGKFYLKKSNNLETWIAKKTYTVDLNAKVLDVFDKALREAGLIYDIRDMNNYIYAITRNGVELEEFTNGPNSGWLYTLNGRYSLLGVNEQFLENGDNIVFHYTDDWTRDEAADIVDPGSEWGGRDNGETEIDTAAQGGGIPTSTVEIEATETREAGGDTTKAEVKSEDVKAAIDTAKENNTSAVSVTVKGDANTKIADVVLPKASAKEIADNGLEFVVKSPVGDLSFDKDALNTIAARAGDTLEVIIADEGKTETVATDNKAFTLTVKVGDAELTALGGTVAVALPYAKDASEDAELLTVYKLEADGTYTEIKDAKYDAATGKAAFTTSETGSYFVSEWISPFADIAKSAWYYKSVRYAYSNGLMNGTGDAAYSPGATLTRAMLVTILAREAGIDTTNGDTWYSKAIEWGIANGVTDGTDPNGAVTREQFAAMLYRYAGNPRPNGGFGEYSDAADVSSYAEDAMAWAVESGIITGRTETTLAPAGTATRAEASTMLQRCLEKAIQR